MLLPASSFACDCSLLFLCLCAPFPSGSQARASCRWRSLQPSTGSCSASPATPASSSVSVDMGRRKHENTRMYSARFLLLHAHTNRLLRRIVPHRCHPPTFPLPLPRTFHLQLRAATRTCRRPPRRRSPRRRRWRRKHPNHTHTRLSTTGWGDWRGLSFLYCDRGRYAHVTRGIAGCAEVLGHTWAIIQRRRHSLCAVVSFVIRVGPTALGCWWGPQHGTHARGDSAHIDAFKGWTGVVVCVYT